MAGNLSLRLGVRMDMAMNARDAAGVRYRTFNVAPDVRLEYSGGAFALGFYAVGGNELHTLAGNYDIDYYMTPAIFSTKPAYSPVDAKLKFRFGPFSTNIFMPAFSFCHLACALYCIRLPSISVVICPTVFPSTSTVKWAAS